MTANNVSTSPITDTTRRRDHFKSRSVDALRINRDSIYDLQPIFRAITELSDKLSVVHGLAKAGMYLCQDSGRIATCLHDEIQTMENT